MKINRFIGRRVNGYLNFGITFNDQLTFVTGINGSGKTTVLNCIAALLLPRLDYLASQDFEEIAIEVLNDSNNVSALSAKKNDTITILTCTSVPGEEFPISEAEELETIPPHRLQEYEDDHYRDILSRHKDHPILEFIESLPTPMYLGLDRRSLSMGTDRARYPARPTARRRQRRNIFGRSLEAGLAEALYFAREHFQEDRRRESALDEEFRETLVLELIGFPLFSLSGNFEEPSDAELKNIEEARIHLKQLPELLDVNAGVILERLDPIFEFLNERLKTIRSSAEDSDDRMVALYEWSYNKENLDKISRLSELISQYTKDVNAIKRRTNDYLETVNSFIQDSGKRIMFNNIGELRFKLQGEDQNRHISTFSSGEIQLVVILTHLYFNPEVSTANVFIIDEPELSLHVQWQEKFVDGIMGASEETQFIVATHSPSIILNRTTLCKDLSRQ